MTDRERVELALQTESDGSGFYEHAAKHTNHKLAHAAFEMLAKEEVRHVQLIESLGQALESGDEVKVDSPNLKSLEKTVQTIYGDATAEPVEGEMEPAEAYAKAIELEKKISALYFEWTDACESDAAKHLFGVLYREEQDHLSLLEDMLGYLTDPSQWFVDRDMVMLDGG
jgi:rubrerythrin